MLYALQLYSAICQLNLHKTGKTPENKTKLNSEVNKHFLPQKKETNIKDSSPG